MINFWKIFNDRVLQVIQYFLAIFLFAGFVLALIPFAYNDLFYVLAFTIVLEMLVSLLRGDILSILLEVLLLVLAVLSLIPFLGYLFRIIGFFVALFNMGVKTNSRVIRVSNNFGFAGENRRNYNKSKKKYESKSNSSRRNRKKFEKGKNKKRGDVIDAEFKEK